MATAKKAKKATAHSKRAVVKKTERVVAKAGKPAGNNPAPGAVPAAASSGQSATGLRVRMYRVGFGDFFLLTVPTGKGQRHILIDCGVHAKDLGSIKDAVAQMAADCEHQLALVIMTHRHADHISGFGTCADTFSQIAVERVWMPWFENRDDQKAVAIQTHLTALASNLSLRLAARGDAESPFAAMVGNIIGDMAVGGSSNQKALDVLHGGFKNKVEPDYYKAGDPAKLPQDLVDAGFSAQILGPPGDTSLITQMTNVNDQYLTEDAQTDEKPMKTPFSKAFQIGSYLEGALRFYGADKVKELINGIQPDVLAAQAKAADNTLNNQSLVILFSFAGKNLLFVGDAQWGNWENFLYGGAYGTPGHTEMTKTARDILNKIDFYKVGHHGSRNATPKDVVAAMKASCVCMCSTQIHAYNEVPRQPLMDALKKQMQGQLARSDQIAISGAPANPDAGPLPSKFTPPPPGKLFIDYVF